MASEIEREKLKEIVQEYLRELDGLEKQRSEELCKITESDLLLEWEIHDKYLELENKLQEKYAEKLQEILDEVSLEWADDTTLVVGNKVVDDHVQIFYYYTYSGELRSEIVPLINAEKTPFTYRVAANMPWQCVRPIWYPNIRNAINELAEAELRRELDKKIDEIIDRLEAGSWVYEYRHLLNALEKTLEEMKSDKPQTFSS